MSSNANRSLCDDPFRACLNWRNTRPPSSPTSPSESPTHNPTTQFQLGSIRQEPTPAVPMNLVNPTSNIQPVPKSVTAQSDAWRAFGTALKTLEAGIGIFPPLKTAVSELLECTMHIQVTEQNRQKYDQLASDLVDLVHTLQTHLPDSKPRWMPYSIENVARSIGEQAAHIKRQQDRSGLTEAIRASDDEVDIIGCYRRIQHIFHQLQIDISLSIWDLTHAQWVETRLKDLNPVHDARYDAGLSMDMQRRGCTPNTRVKILKEAIYWTRNLDAAKIYWMNGMAGTGKTTIAYSLCGLLEESKQLGACFFCSRASPDCRNVNRIVPTIAYQLARFSNPYQKELCEVLSNNPDVAKKEVSAQFQRLIVGPLSKVKGAIPVDVVIVIDALDEFSDARGTQLILELLFRQAMSLPVKFFVTSRPEPNISRKVGSSEDTYRLVLHLHDVEESLVKDDIHTYLEDELSTKAKPEEIERLAVRAGCLFIFAATVVRFIDPNNAAVDHRKRLTTMLGAHTKGQKQLYRALDELYLAILTQALEEVWDEEGGIRRLVLRTVLSAREPLTIPTIAELTGLGSEDEVQLALLPLHSVLRVSLDTKVISTLHASFPDFMVDPARSRAFHCNMSEQNAYMATRCFEIMKKSLKFNICNLETSLQPDQNIQDLQTRVNEAISSGLSYACRYWGEHLDGAKYSNALENMLDGFLRYRLLFWMEVLNLKDDIGYAAATLLQALNFLPPDDTQTELRAMIQDSRNFVTTYAASSASQSTAHIYISALPLASTKSRIREIYWPRMKGLVHIQGTAINDRGDVALATWVTGSLVTALTLSKDGRRIASGAGDGTVSVWDSSKGARLLGPFPKHVDLVCAIGFSSDGTRIASGSNDSKIHIWDAYSGDPLVGPLNSHTASIYALSFSPDDACLASASEDHTIRIWNPLNGAQIGNELSGHRDCVMCVIFTSNGEHLVSCSDDHTIRVWDWRKGITVHGPFEGHTDWVDCVALSPDDTHIASSSRDCTIRVWSIEQGKTVVGPLTGHSDRVASVAYSSDGKRIVSGSFDRTIRIWSSETGDLIAGPFRGHEDWVHSALFSQDDTQIISGSGDGTICIWDANHTITGANTASGGHTKGIMSIALSSDGTRVVSGSLDHTICVWDTSDGTLILGPLAGHTGNVCSVAYTPDGTCIVSGSSDGTIRTWDAHTGSPKASPFTGHTRGVRSVAVSPDGRLVASGSPDYSIKIWDLQTGTEVAKPAMHHTDFVPSVEFSPNGLYIASASGDCSVCLWDTDTGDLVRKFEQHTDSVLSARFSPDGQKIVSCSADQTVLVWGVNTGAVLSGPWEGHKSGVCSVSFSSDGTKVVSGDFHGVIHLWDAEKGTVLATPFKRHTSMAYSVAFTPDNKHLISCSYDSTIRVWDLDTITGTQHQEMGNWVVHDDGWIKDSELRLVLWLPPDLKRIIPIPPCSLVMRAGGSVRANLGDFIYGDRWKDCYDVTANSNTSNM